MEKHTERVESNIPSIEETLAKAYEAAGKDNKDRDKIAVCVVGRSESGKKPLNLRLDDYLDSTR